ncbi:[protein adp-ribosylarginine] hydrolase [Anaeramoeba ignava]|uniref:ADP-ribosylhydrolase ARH1 n=1 Tax=Anaeramoeba ignava TaxID=1746090 RepID=A0A9Q0RBL1_ANAIG|nr:[protein adp-ribosylarginine] hydrolase [Anaeramoeba ignava]|eukprot:Anaeramoba_ignava/c18347_g2_i1.p1 GENE.c18347_g2_i1~~c18347_g2_i1.p1  ORF type:complete len:378 (-),score=132.56 c18347_g2_i1:77-1210(-)
MEKFKASMLLGGVGDSMGYHDKEYEFQYCGKLIHEDVNKITNGKGISALHLKGSSWKVSDDTVMMIATAESLLDSVEKGFLVVDPQNPKIDLPKVMGIFARKYVDCMNDMDNRMPGASVTGALLKIKDNPEEKWNSTPFRTLGGGCGAAMRSMPIGLLFHDYENPQILDLLISVSIESGRITHHHPVGYLGGLVSALYISFALHNLPIVEWGKKLLQIIKEKVPDYLEKAQRFAKENIDAVSTFIDHWEKYLKLRQIFGTDQNVPIFPDVYDIQERDDFYKSISFKGWGGSSGHDSVIIAYDALLGSKVNWEELCLRGVLHGGDSDSTGVIACSTYGALKGFKEVPELNYKDLEYHDRLIDLGEKLFKISNYEEKQK